MYNVFYCSLNVTFNSIALHYGYRMARWLDYNAVNADIFEWFRIWWLQSEPSSVYSLSRMYESWMIVYSISDA